MRGFAPHLTLDSAGTGAWHIGEPPYAPMQAAARRRGIDMSGLRARQFQGEDFWKFDLIVAMDLENLSNIERQRPKNCVTEASLFTDFGNTSETAVPDPYYTRDFDGTLDLIMLCAKGLVAKL